MLLNENRDSHLIMAKANFPPAAGTALRGGVKTGLGAQMIDFRITPRAAPACPTIVDSGPILASPNGAYTAVWGTAGLSGPTIFEN